MMNRNRIEWQIRRRRQRMLAELNRNDQGILAFMIRAALMVLAVVIGISIWLWAAGQQADMEVQAAVLRKHRIMADMEYSLGPGVLLGASPELPIIVESIPETLPAEEGPPAAIEIQTQANAFNELEGEKEHWESLGVWKLTAYCPLECCNGKGRAWKTASGIPMAIGDTVATGRLPFGTKLKINGHIYTVTDRGVPYGQVDILHVSHRAANNFGIQRAEVFILR